MPYKQDIDVGREPALVWPHRVAKIQAGSKSFDAWPNKSGTNLSEKGQKKNRGKEF